MPSRMMVKRFMGMGGFGGGAAAPVTTNVGMLADAFTWLALPDTNRGALDYFYSRGGATATCVGLIKPDLSGIPAGTITSAKLHLFQHTSHPAAGTVITLYNILTTWTEAGAKWNYSEGVTRWPGDTGADGGADAGCTVIGTDHSATAIGTFSPEALDPEGTEYIINLDLEQFALLQAINNGLALRSNADSYTKICTKEHATAGYRPYIEVITGGVAGGDTPPLEQGSVTVHTEPTNVYVEN